MTGVLVFGSMAQKAEKSGNLYRLTGLLEVERPDGPCFHIHKLDDLRIFVGIDYPVALRRDAKSTPLIFCLVPTNFVIGASDYKISVSDYIISAGDFIISASDNKIGRHSAIFLCLCRYVFLRIIWVFQ